jgi:hypothetical protein
VGRHQNLWSSRMYFFPNLPLFDACRWWSTWEVRVNNCEIVIPHVGSLMPAKFVTHFMVRNIKIFLRIRHDLTVNSNNNNNNNNSAALVREGLATVCRTALVVTVQEHCIAYCSCREAVKLFRFLLSPYSLVETCNGVQNCTCSDCTGTLYSLL